MQMSVYGTLRLSANWVNKIPENNQGCTEKKFALPPKSDHLVLGQRTTFSKIVIQIRS